jgi:hypothetical protein
MGAFLESMDGALQESRDNKRYRYVNKKQTTLKTVMGEVTFSRVCYKVRGSEASGHVYLLDEAVGLAGRKGFVSENLAQKIVNECLDKSYRKAAASVSTMTGQTISHAGAWGVLQRVGRQVEGKEERLVELNKAGVLRGEIENKVLFEEMDGVYLSMQGKDRPEKMGKRELKVATCYSGWEETAKGRYETVGKVAYAGFESAEEFHHKREAVTAFHYNVDEIEVRVLNGDGASWIKSSEEDVIQQLDPFHRSQAVMRYISDAEDRKTLQRVIGEKNVDNILLCVEALCNSVTEEKEVAKRKKLLTYFSENKEHLLNWKERGQELPPPPEGVVYRLLGTQEHSNCDIIAQRMKHRKASWSIRGGGHMAKLLCWRASTGLDVFFTEPEEAPLAEEKQSPLSSAKAPQRDGKGGVGSIPRVGWPFAEAAVTAGRKAVQRILEYRPFTHLPLR